MWKIITITLLALTSAVQLRKHKRHRFDMRNDKKYAYVTLWMDRSVPEAAGEAKPRNLMVSSSDSELPVGGSKAYNEDFIFKMSDQMKSQGMEYPLVVVTNDPALQTSEKLKEYPNIVIKAVGKDLPNLMTDDNLKKKVEARNKMHVQKLSVFGLTEYDRLLYLDMDVEINKNLDHVFSDYDTRGGQQVWGLLNDFTCVKDRKKMEKNGDYFNSAVMLFQPTAKVAQELPEFAHKLYAFKGDQLVIQRYFNEKEMGQKKLMAFKSSEDTQKAHGQREANLFPLDLADQKACHKNAKDSLEVAHLR